VELATRAAERAGRPLLVSGGNSSSLDLAFEEGLPGGVTNLRIGESILLGVSTISRDPLEGLHQDAFVLEAPVIECRLKPSLPTGETAQDAFGRRPSFADRGPRMRAICALGRQDTVPENLQPLDPGVEILGASSDHLILDVQGMTKPPRVGQMLRFLPGYGALLLASTSPYVDKVFDSEVEQ
jgi:predicted amino acid racemase